MPYFLRHPTDERLMTWCIRKALWCFSNRKTKNGTPCMYVIRRSETVLRQKKLRSSRLRTLPACRSASLKRRSKPRVEEPRVRVREVDGMLLTWLSFSFFLNLPCSSRSRTWSASTLHPRPTNDIYMFRDNSNSFIQLNTIYLFRLFTTFLHFMLQYIRHSFPLSAVQSALQLPSISAHPLRWLTPLFTNSASPHTPVSLALNPQDWLDWYKSPGLVARASSSPLTLKWRQQICIR